MSIFRMSLKMSLFSAQGNIGELGEQVMGECALVPPQSRRRDLPLGSLITRDLLPHRCRSRMPLSGTSMGQKQTSEF